MTSPGFDEFMANCAKVEKIFRGIKRVEAFRILWATVALHAIVTSENAFLPDPPNGYFKATARKAWELAVAMSQDDECPRGT